MVTFTVMALSTSSYQRVRRLTWPLLLLSSAADFFGGGSLRLSLEDRPENLLPGTSSSRPRLCVIALPQS
jgi:hypothetical protein